MTTELQCARCKVIGQFKIFSWGKPLLKGVGEVSLRKMSKEELLEYCDSRGYGNEVKDSSSKEEIIRSITELKSRNVACKCKKCLLDPTQPAKIEKQNKMTRHEKKEMREYESKVFDAFMMLAVSHPFCKMFLKKEMKEN